MEKYVLCSVFANSIMEGCELFPQLTYNNMDYKTMHDKKNRPKLEKDGVAIVATLRKLGIDRMEVNYPILNLIIMH